MQENEEFKSNLCRIYCLIIKEKQKVDHANFFYWKNFSDKKLISFIKSTFQKIEISCVSIQRKAKPLFTNANQFL